MHDCLAGSDMCDVATRYGSSKHNRITGNKDTKVCNVTESLEHLLLECPDYAIRKRRAVENHAIKQYINLVLKHSHSLALCKSF